MKIITLGEAKLREKSAAVDDISILDKELLDFINGMFEAMHKGRGIGLAAVQVGRLARVFITHAPNDQPRIFINPEILETSIEQDSYEEGCLSIPGVNADVIRPYAVKVQACNTRGRPFTLDAEGLLARVIQHELDHLNGKLFIDYLNDALREKLLKQYFVKENAQENTGKVD